MPLGALRLWAASEIRAQWRSLVVLGLLVGLAAGLAMAAMAGARRTATAYERYRKETGAIDAFVFGTQLGRLDIDYSPLRKLPEVEDMGEFVLAPVGLKEYPKLGGLPADDDRLYVTIGRPLIRKGRLPDASRDDEIVVNQAAAKTYRLDVGDTVTLISGTSIDAFFGTAEMSGGPTVKARVVGIGDTDLHRLLAPDEPIFTPSAGLLAHHPEIPRGGNAVVRLRAGTDIAAFTARVEQALGTPGIPVRDTVDDRRRITRATDLERWSLLLFALGVVGAAIVLIGQAMGRTLDNVLASAPALRSLGLSRRDLVTGALATVMVAAAVGALVAPAVAISASRFFPIGLARSLEPSLGMHADWRVIAGGTALAIVVVAAGAVAVAAADTRARHRAPLPGPAANRVMNALRSAVPVSVAVGVGFAVDRGRGTRSLPTRPAFIAATVGVAAFIGAAALGQAITEAVTHPEQAGQVWAARLYPNESHSLDDIAAELRDESIVASIATMEHIPVVAAGRGVPAHSLDPITGRLTFVTTDGRGPVGDDEVAIGPSTAKALHKRIGDRLSIEGSSGRAVYRVVGYVLLPQTPHSSFDQGLWLAPRGLRRVAASSGEEDIPSLLVSVRKGTAAGQVDALVERLGLETERAGPPPDVVSLRTVRTLPYALAAFLGVLGLATLAHVLVATLRRRRHEMVVLRALGMRPRQAAIAIMSLSATVTAVAAVVGLPAGTALGRLVWSAIAASTPLVYVAPFAAIAYVVAPVVLAAANVLAVLPARRASRLRPAEVLRTE